MGFSATKAATLRVDPPRSYKGADQVIGYFNEVLRRTREIPGVDSAGLTDAIPLGKNRSWSVPAKGQTYPPGQFPDEYIRIISDGYFSAMRIPMRAGRDFTEHDRVGAPLVAIVNESLARRLWPGQDPIGQELLNRKPITVVGVVGDVRHLALEKDAGLELYFPIRQTGDFASVDLVVRARTDPAALAGAVRASLLPVNSSLPANEFRPLERVVDNAVSPRRFIVVLLGGFAGIALMLASLGIYGVISYSVSQRTQEIGIRMALGASAQHVRMRVLRQAMTLAAIGILVGGVGAWGYGAVAGDVAIRRVGRRSIDICGDGRVAGQRGDGGGLFPAGGLRWWIL